MGKKHKFGKGNEFWKQRSSHGPNPKFEDPEALLDACNQYFEWAHNNPLFEADSYTYKGKRRRTAVPRLRAMTVKGMCIYIGIASSTWDSYCEKDEFFDVTSYVKNVIFVQKFEGAAVNQLNPSIIARDLGLKDHKDLSSEDGSMTPRGLDDFYSEESES